MGILAMMACMTTSIQKTIELLTSFGYVEHVDMIEPLLHDEADVVVADQEGVLLKHACGSWLASAKTEAAATKFIELVNDHEIFCTHGEIGMEQYRACLGRPEVQNCYKVVLEHELPETVADRSIKQEFTFRPLDESHFDLVVAHYHTAPAEYVRGRLKSGVMLGAWSGNHLAGFIGRHTEGAMGLLEIVPEFRRKGLATALESELCRRLQQEGRIPYADIFTDNEASLALHRKLGFTFAKGFFHWLDID